MSRSSRPRTGPTLTRLRQAVDASGEVVFMTDQGGIFTFVNRRFEEFYGYPAQEVIGRVTPRILRGGLVPKEAYAEFWKTLLEGRPLNYAFANRTRDGEIVHVEASVSAIKDARGALVGYLAVQRDVSARKAAEEAFRESQARLQLISENVLDLFSQIDLDGKYIYVSSSYRVVLGYEPASLVGTSAFERVHPEDRQNVERALETAARTRTPRRAEFRYRHAAGHYVWLETVGKVIDDSHGRTTAVLSTRDLTERKRIEEELRQSHKLETLGSLAGGIAHDFNNVLTAILGYTDLVLAETGPTGQMREDLEEVRRAAASAESLTRQLLIFSRKAVVQPVLVHLNDVVTGLEKMLRRTVGEHVMFTIELGDQSGFVNIDVGQIEQVLMNLVVNARDAMPRGGTLTIATRTDGDSAHRHEVLSVADTGCGMAPEIRAKIFDPFFTTKGPEKGTGLGLATVQRIVETAGGRISVESAPGIGSTFTVALPRAADVPHRATAHEASTTPNGRERVLFVEDNDAIRAMAARALRRFGYDVTTARDGADAMNIGRAARVNADVLVTDVVMPGMNGHALWQQIRSAHPACRVLFTSGFVADPDLLADVQSRNLPLLRKPYTMEGLAQAIRKIVDEPPRPA
jgi:two-component system cell cycle sensor histidine kinase/response regulator CckA